MIGAFLTDDGGRRLPVDGPVVLGRVRESDITFDLPAVSRAHAEIGPRAGAWWVRDLGSRNGTFLNGAAIGADPVRIGEGDVIVLAGAVTLTFHDPAATPIAPRIGRLSGVWIDPESDAVWVDATRIEPPLSPRQLDLLRLLDTRVGEIVTRAEIVAIVWADAAASGVSDEAVTALIKRLRSRLRETPVPTDHLQVVKGRGVRLTRPPG
ncbi:MAG: FHA domain-containing protein [Actinomycetota bacterium]